MHHASLLHVISPVKCAYLRLHVNIIKHNNITHYVHIQTPAYVDLRLCL